MRSASLLAFCTGFLSLSLEILWIRLFGFANHSVPQSFAFVLTAFLIGIALGAYLGKEFCRRKINLWVVSGAVLLVSSVFTLISPWIYASLVFSGHQLLTGGLLIAGSALLISIVFPIAHHLGTPMDESKVGRNISRVYVANIAGATLGPLFTGIFLLASVTTQQGFIIIAMLTLLVAVYCLWQVLNTYIIALSSLTLFAQFVMMIGLDGHGLIAKVCMPMQFPVTQILENQYGIITIYKGNGEDIVAGGNAYDGTTNLDPIRNTNHINRVIILSALVEHPRRVLMVGLSIGSWLKILTAFPDVELIDVVEINPGYLKLIEQYPLQHSGVQDPRVHVYYDDGRRWLKAHPDRHYDMIIMNTTFHWRMYVSNLLSVEFLQLLKSHLNPDAVLAYNGTNSPDTLKTAQTIFNHAYNYENFIVASDSDWRVKLHAPLAVDKILALKLDGKPLYGAENRAVVNRQVNLPIQTLKGLESFYNVVGRKLEVITDNNLITEYKYGECLV